MSGDDTRVVNMRINNKDFLKGTSDSLRALDSLNKGVDNAGKGKGMQNLSQSVQTVKTHFGAMQVAGVAALATITSKAVSAGLSLLHGFTIAPIMDGFREYQKILNSTQTIMANTGKKVGPVKQALDQLNHYSDQTIYNFGQMADSIGKFTAAGVNIKDSVASIKGLANSAALSGSSVDQLNTAMYQMSQALSQGNIKLMDWNSLANAGMGGSNIREALMATTRTLGDHGKAMDESIRKQGSFRNSLQSGWLSAKIFTKTMKVMGGTTTSTGKTIAYSVKQLKEMGFASKAAKHLNKLSQAAIDSATKIKTFSQLLDVTKEAVGSGWSQIFSRLFGNFSQATKMWTSVGQQITGTISLIFNAVDRMLGQWQKAGGYKELWAGIGNIFKSIGNLLRPLVMLFMDLTPGTKDAGNALFSLTDAFFKFSVWLEKVTSGTKALDPAMQGLANILGMVFGIIGAVVGAQIDLLKIFSPLANAVGNLALALLGLIDRLFAMIGFDSGISDLFKNFVTIRAEILTPFVNTLVAIVNALTDLVNGDVSGFKDKLSGAFSNLMPLGEILKQGKQIAMDLIAGLSEGLSSGSIQVTVSDFVNNMVDFFKGLLGINSPSTVFAEFGRNIVEGLVNGLIGAVSLIGEGIKALGDALMGMDKFDFANMFSVLFGGAVFLTIYKFTNALGQTMKTFKSFSENLMGKDGLLGQTTQTMKTMQTGIKAQALLNIAIAIGVLAVSLWILSKIPADKLAIGMGVITFMMYQLIGVMKAMSAGAATTKTAIASMTAMAIAMGIMAFAILILSAAVLAFGMMPTGVLVKGMLAVGAALVILGAASYVLGLAAPTMILAAAGILILSLALGALAPVILLYSKISWDTLWSGLLKMGAALVVLGIAMIPLSSIAPMLLIASAALIVLSVGLTAMLGVIGLFSKVSWGTLMGGVAKISAALIVLGLAAIIASPGLILLGAAAILIGAGFLAAGIGMALFGAGLTVVVAAGTAGAAVLVSAFEAFLAILPLMAVQLVAALASFLGALAEKSPQIVTSIVKIATELLRGLVEMGPKIAKAAISLLHDFLDAFVASRLMIFQAGLDLILGFLDALNDGLPKIITAGKDLIVNFINGISDSLTDIIDAGTHLIIKFLQGISDSSDKIITAAGDTILAFLDAIDAAIVVYEPQIIQKGKDIGLHLVEGLVQGLVPQPVLDAFNTFVDDILNFVKGKFGIHSPSTVFAGYGRNIVQGLVNGLAGFGGTIKGVFTRGFSSAKTAVTNGVNAIGDAIGKIPGIIRGKISAVGSAARSVGSTIVDGIKSGLKATIGAIGGLGSAVMSAVKGAINSALNLPFVIKLHIPIPGAPDINFGPKTIIPRFAKGITGFSGGSALVGEAGPELVTMGRGSNVITNKKLESFMKAVSALTRAMTSGSKSQNSPGGNIVYKVGADFQGDPKSSGIAFAANITAGLINGLKTQQPMVNATMAAVGSNMSKSFMDILGIHSPSTVFNKYASYVGQGFINGLLASVAGVQAAAKLMATSAIDVVSKTISDGALKLEAQSAKADAYSAAAALLRQKAKDKNLSRAKKNRLLKEAAILDAKAKVAQKLADTQQKALEKATAAAERKAQYDKADAQGKADMKNEDAKVAAENASAYRQKALRLALEANLVRKYDKIRAAELDKQAKAALLSSQRYADKAALYATQAAALTKDALSSQITMVSAADVLKAQTMFDQYTKLMSDSQAAAAKDELVPPISLTQNNYSPEALSTSEVYRNTKNLVSTVERKLVGATP